MPSLRAASLALPVYWRLRQALLASLSPHEARALLEDWRFWARDDQLAPASDWTTWLLLGGRGAGKTRAGAEWIRTEVKARRAGRIALIGETLGDVREVMIDGPSGLRAIEPSRSRPRYEASRKRLLWQNGAVAYAFSASEPDSLRGPQFDAAWADEIAKWRYAETAWDMLQFGLRLGDNPRQVVTTTPRPVPIVKQLLKDRRTVMTKASTLMNRAYLAEGFFQSVIARYQGTRLGRQELDAELIEDNPDALWSRDMIDATRVTGTGEMTRIVVAVDPPATSGPKADECGIIVAGRDATGRAYVLEDRSMGGLTPLTWATRAVKAMRDHEADRLVAEANQGGEMVAAILQQVAPHVPLKLVRASRSKLVRAEPVAALYERGLVAHVGHFARLEDQMCDHAPGSGAKSPDRLDALVWALTDLMLDGEAGKPKVRGL